MTVNSRLNGDVPLTDVETAAAAISSDAVMLVSGFGSVGYPKAVPLALADSDRDLELAVVSGGSVGKEIDVALVEADAMARRYPYQSHPPAREGANDRTIAFSDRNVSSLSDDVQLGGMVDPDIAVVEAIAVGEDWLIPSTSVGQTPAFVESADQLIVELNYSQPLELQTIHDVYRPASPPAREPIPLTEPDGRIGDPIIRFEPEKLVAVVETELPDSTYTFREPTEDDRNIARQLGRFLDSEMKRTAVFEDAIPLQFGVGSLGNALMGELIEMEFNGRDVIYFGEVIQDGLLDMLDEGSLKSASATTLALSEEGQDRLFSDIERYAEDIVLRPADVSNNPALIRQFGVIGVNSALEVDLYGHVNSTHVHGTRAINGIGGSGDYNRNSLITVCALPSTLSDGEISRIVPLTFHVDHTEHDIDVIITEQGIADIRGLAPHERAERIINNCAHPSFRPQLREYFDQAKQQGGHIPHDLEAAISWQE